ncbi:hypothetical protein H4R34_003172 [Dimargaris verticillata]|uniref:RING-type E3 ubiquitin transferase n=1 Tax=Dimargaris verticillata TaxID=2761393 RepID=A0A9W8B6K6_9FUNG|nr:hypothetical protein H4R34_003172 [Dimargaris verticillata]
MDLDEVEFCRVCRGEATPDEPLFHPCKCTGSIKHVHQDCLVEWLSHSKKTKCELCGHEFRFSPVYDPNMPQHIPFYVVIKRLLYHAVAAVVYVLRVALVGFVWFILLPYMTVWVLRFYFWTGQTVVYGLSGDPSRMPRFINYTQTLRQQQQHLLTMNWNSTLLSAVLGDEPNATQQRLPPAVHQFLLDCLEGDVITCVVVFIFIAMFVLREWIVANAPVPHLEVDVEEPQQPLPIQPQMERANLGLPPLAPPIDHQAPEIPDHRHGGFFPQQQQPPSAGSPASSDTTSSDEPPHFAPVPTTHQSANQPFYWNDPASPWDADDLADGSGPVDHDSEPPQPQPQLHTQSHSVEAPSTPFHPYQLRRRRAQPSTSHAEDDQDQSSSRLSPPSRRDDKQPLFAAQEPSERYDTRANDEAGPSAAAQSSSAARPQMLDHNIYTVGFNHPLPSPYAPEVQERQRGARNPTMPIRPLAHSGVGDDLHAPYGAHAEGRSQPLPHEQLHNLPEWPVPEDDANAWAATNDDTFPPPLTSSDDDSADSSDNEEPPALDFPADPAQDDLLDADGIDGVLEALGVRGPFINLFQYFALIFALVSLVLGLAVCVPYMLGKFILVLNPFKILLLPLQLLQLATDPVIELVVDQAFPTAFRSAQTYWQSWQQMAQDYTGSTGFTTETTTASPPSTIVTAWLHPMVAIGQSAVQSVTDGTTALLHWLFAFSSSSSWTKPLAPLDHRLTPVETPATASMVPELSLTTLLQHIQTGWDHLAHGQSLGDHALTCVIGYGLILLGAVYIMQGGYDFAGERARVVKRTVYTSLLMLKVVVFLVIELALFPFVCGWLIDASTLPLFPASTTLQSRFAFAQEAPLTSVFLHWFAGTAFMFRFALFMAQCRDMVRPGVMWFIRDPHDPNFHPMKEILEKPTLTQCRKIGVSLIMYAVMIVLGLGVAIYGIAYCPPLLPAASVQPVLPLNWKLAQPLSPIPFDLLALYFVVPFTLRRIRLRHIAKRVTRQWWALAARGLRLTSFMFDRRVPNEEGYFEYATWGAWLRGRRFPLPHFTVHSEDDQWDYLHDADRLDAVVQATLERPDVRQSGLQIVLNSAGNQVEVIRHRDYPDVAFHPDGGFLRVPNFDGIPVVPDHRLLVRVNRQGIPLDPTEDYLEQRSGLHPSLQDTNGRAKFIIVYAPSRLRLRLLLFVVLLWASLATALGMGCVVPLLTGRALLTRFLVVVGHLRSHPLVTHWIATSPAGSSSSSVAMGSAVASWLAVDDPTQLHDLYSLVLGWYLCGLAIWAIYHGYRKGKRFFRKRRLRTAPAVDGSGRPYRPSWISLALRALVNGVQNTCYKLIRAGSIGAILGIVLPLALGIVAELYVGSPTRMAAVYSVKHYVAHSQLPQYSHHESLALDMATNPSVSPSLQSDFTPVLEAQPAAVTATPELADAADSATYKTDSTTPDSARTARLAKVAQISPDQVGLTLDSDWLARVLNLAEPGTIFTSTATEPSQPLPAVLRVPHGWVIFVLQCWALGLVVVKLGHTAMLAFPQAPWGDVWRRAFPPNAPLHQANLSVLCISILMPALALTTLAVGAPPLLAIAGCWYFLPWALTSANVLAWCYPLCFALALGSFSLYTGIRWWQEWIAAVRQEEYVVGQRLHNLGASPPSPTVIATAG